jgi:hypothetical protein
MYVLGLCVASPNVQWALNRADSVFVLITALIAFGCSDS